MFTCTVKFRVNDIVVASKQFKAKTQAGLDRLVGRYKSSTEFIIRATLKQSGVDRATITICEDDHELMFPWLSAGDTFGLMQEAKITHW